MFDFWFDWVKPKYEEKSNLCCMETDNFIVSIKTSDIYKDIAEDVETRYVTSNITERETQKCNWFNER